MFRVPVAGIEVVKNGKYYCLKRTSDNYFTGDGLGKVELPLKVRVTAVTGEQREAVLPSMSVSDILTDEQFSGFAAGRKSFNSVRKKCPVIIQSLKGTI